MRNAVDAAPKDFFVHFNYGLFLWSRGRAAEAIAQMCWTDRSKLPRPTDQ
jgi:Tfp pilus assembly protein PilF